MNTTEVHTSVSLTVAEWRTIHDALRMAEASHVKARTEGRNPWPTAGTLAARIWDQGVVGEYTVED